MLVGLGTVRDPETAQRAQDEGADFLVSPHLVPDVRAATTLPLIEGGWTPTEMAAATRGGIAKLFPAHVGGPAYLRTLRAVLPDAEIVPTGGIEPEQVEDMARGRGTRGRPRVRAWSASWTRTRWRSRTGSRASPSGSLSESAKRWLTLGVRAG